MRSVPDFVTLMMYFLVLFLCVHELIFFYRGLFFQPSF